MKKSKMKESTVKKYASIITLKNKLTHAMLHSQGRSLSIRSRSPATVEAKREATRFPPAIPPPSSFPSALRRRWGEGAGLPDGLVCN